MIVTPRSVSSFLKKPDPSVRAVLVYGSDEGLVRERAETLLLTVVADLRDPFCVTDFRADILKDDPARLADEAAAIAMTGDRRVVRVRNAANGHAKIFEDFLTHPVGDALIVVESGALAKNAALRKLFEKAEAAAALPCYPDEGHGLVELIADHLLSRHGLKVEPGALTYLADRLGSDRRMTRQELDKLALFKGSAEGSTITLEDAEQAVGDGGSVQLDEIVYAATGGDMVGLDRNLARYYSAGENSIPLLRALSRHLERLQWARADVDCGSTPARAMESLRPPVFFKKERSFSQQLQMWSRERLITALQIVLDAEIDSKTTGLPPDVVCGRALLRIGNAARTRATRGDQYRR